ncbi:MAG: hypothetical protein ACM31O_01590 [Bacteroidota bacterium]
MINGQHKDIAALMQPHASPVDAQTGADLTAGLKTAHLTECLAHVRRQRNEAHDRLADITAALAVLRRAFDANINELAAAKLRIESLEREIAALKETAETRGAPTAPDAKDAA